MKKITVGLFIDVFYPMIDGVVSVVDNYAKRLVKYCNVVVFAPSYNKEFNDNIFPYKVVRCKSIKVPTIDYSLPIVDSNFKEELNKYKLDIVHIHSPFTLGKLGVKYAKKNNIPCVVTMHSQFKQDFMRTFKNDKVASFLTKNIVIKLYDKCDESFAVSNTVAHLFHEDYGYRKLPKVINNATDMIPIDKKEADSYINSLYNINKDTKVLLFVGRINKLKNIFFIVDALKAIGDKLDYKMLFVGTGGDLEDLSKYIMKNNLEDKVILCGKVTDRNLLAKYYSRADLFLFPSMYDTSSLVQVEAASQKTPTLFIKGAVTCSNITDKENGYISENDPKKYGRYIVDILKNKKMYNEVAKKCYNDLYISWDTQVEKLYKEYLNIIGE